MENQEDTQYQSLCARMDAFEKSVQENTALTQKNSKDTEEILEIFRSMKGGAEVLRWIGNIVKWAAGIGASVVVLYFAFKNGAPPQ
jgi:hypothetical protein